MRKTFKGSPATILSAACLWPCKCSYFWELCLKVGLFCQCVIDGLKVTLLHYIKSLEDTDTEKRKKALKKRNHCLHLTLIIKSHIITIWCVILDCFLRVCKLLQYSIGYMFRCLNIRMFLIRIKRLSLCHNKANMNMKSVMCRCLLFFFFIKTSYSLSMHYEDRQHAGTVLLNPDERKP